MRVRRQRDLKFTLTDARGINNRSHSFFLFFFFSFFSFYTAFSTFCSEIYFPRLCRENSTFHPSRFNSNPANFPDTPEHRRVYINIGAYAETFLPLSRRLFKESQPRRSLRLIWNSLESLEDRDVGQRQRVSAHHFRFPV